MPVRVLGESPALHSSKDIFRNRMAQVKMVGKPAPNTISDGQKCSGCEKNVDLDKEGISCRLCDLWFHAINCDSVSSNDNICGTSHFTTLKSAITKTAGFTKRFGKLYFVCDSCETVHEQNKTVTTKDKVDILDGKLSEMQSRFDVQLGEMKSLICGLNAKANEIPPTTAPFSLNPWDDTQRAEGLRHMMVIKKDSDGKTADDEKLEKACVDNGISVIKTFKLKNSEDKAVIVKSKGDLVKLHDNLKHSLPAHELNDVSARTPRITVVGLPREYGKEELADMIIRQNHGIEAVFHGSIASDEDKMLEVVAVVPLLKNPSVFRAIVKVSNLIRSVIAKQGDRVCAGLQSRCRVYDSFFVLRCYNCQKLGHHSSDCKLDQVCGHCAKDHKTSDCPTRNDPLSARCANCTTRGDAKSEADLKHPASDSTCPLMVEAQRKLKQSIPFYQRTNLAQQKY